jgi:DNA adenine methylase
VTLLEQMNHETRLKFLRYPGGKQRLLFHFSHLLPKWYDFDGNYIEPFVGGASVFFHVNPKYSILSDVNTELIDVYQGVKQFPKEVWNHYKSFSPTKEAYYEIRKWDTTDLDLVTRAARLLFINRTCFKGMWRHNISGQFNVGYGGQDRRWVISEEDLQIVSARLQKTELRCSDFESTLDLCKVGDFVFLDPPYRPGDREMNDAHYSYGTFKFEDQYRLLSSLINISERGVKWVMTNSSHPDIINLYSSFNVTALQRGTGKKIGNLTAVSGEVIISNF